MISAPFYPIIYVRGYAMTAGERDETSADPFCGFNAGSTVYRSAINKSEPPKKFIFESPLLRLLGDFDYEDVYENGSDIVDPDWRPRGKNTGITSRSVVIYRYYESGSSLLGDGKAKPIEDYAKGLSELILRVKQLVLQQEGGAPEAFRCYLVAHSMGGLVARGFLQNKALGSAEARAAVDKFFTYATPHNGIDVAGINVPSWLTLNEADSFNRERLSKFLDMEAAYKKHGRVDYMPESALSTEKIFCMVGTNRSDYEVAKGLSRAFVGHGSDGLVKIENASLWGLDARNEVTGTAATAYTYRAHSGFFGIVNSEEAYQCLTRFLFGDIRVDIWLSIDSVTLPPDLEGKAVEALYQFELQAGPRGRRWFLTRRVAEEDSSACRTHQDLVNPATPGAKLVYLSTVFLANRSRVNQEIPSLAYSMNLGARVPDYQVNKTFWPDQHFEGAYLFQDSLVVEMVAPTTPDGAWDINYGWQSKGVGRANRKLPYTELAAGKLQLMVPFASAPASAKPGIAGNVLLTASSWNAAG